MIDKMAIGFCGYKDKDRTVYFWDWPDMDARGWKTYPTKELAREDAQRVADSLGLKLEVATNAEDFQRKE
jgi:hypothetical protein